MASFGLMGLATAAEQQQLTAQSQPWWGDYQAAKQWLWNTNDYEGYKQKIGQIAAKYGVTDPSNLLGQLAGNDIAESQGNRSPWYKEDSGLSAAQAGLIGATLGTGAAAAGGAFGGSAAAEGGTAGSAASAGGTSTGVGGAAASGGGMGFGGDMFGNLADWGWGFDPTIQTTLPATSGLGPSAPAPDPSALDWTADPFGQTPADIGGSTAPLSNVGSGDFFNPMASGGFGLPSWLANAPGYLKSLFGGMVPSGLSGLLPSMAQVGSTVPGLLALAYADRQPGIDTSGLEGVLGKLGGNQDAVIKAATDPLQMNIAAGYGDLLQSQSLRGIRGSSFGNTDIANYLSTTGNTLANAGANAAEGSLQLQGNLAAEIAALKNQAQQTKNALFGRAFDTLGRGLNPKSYGLSITGTG